MFSGVDRMRREFEYSNRKASNSSRMSNTRSKIVRDEELNRIFEEVNLEREKSMMEAYYSFEEMTDEEKSRSLMENDIMGCGYDAIEEFEEEERRREFYYAQEYDQMEKNRKGEHNMNNAFSKRSSSFQPAKMDCE